MLNRSDHDLRHGLLLTEGRALTIGVQAHSVEAARHNLELHNVADASGTEVRKDAELRKDDLRNDGVDGRVDNGERSPLSGRMGNPSVNSIVLAGHAGLALNLGEPSVLHKSLGLSGLLLVAEIGHSGFIEVGILASKGDKVFIHKHSIFSPFYKFLYAFFMQRRTAVLTSSAPQVMVCRPSTRKVAPEVTDAAGAVNLPPVATPQS